MKNTDTNFRLKAGLRTLPFKTQPLASIVWFSKARFNHTRLPAFVNCDNAIRRAESTNQCSWILKAGRFTTKTRATDLRLFSSADGRCRANAGGRLLHCSSKRIGA